MGFNPFEKIGRAAAGAGQFVQRAAGGAAKAAGEGAQQIAGATSDAARQVVKAVDRGVNQLGDIAAGTAAQAATTLQNDVAPALQKGANDAAQAAGDLMSAAKKMLFNPVFKEDVESEQFVLPKMIQVVDAGDKRPVDLEYGAIGWWSKEGSLGVLRIYEDALGLIDCEFCPHVASKARLVYYVDQLDPHRYINLAQYIDVIAEEKKAELLDIAYWLGAKRCRLECCEEKRSVISAEITGKRTLRATEVPLKETKQIGVDAARDKYGATSTLFAQEYGGSDTPQRPELHWYEHDPKILQFIEARCDPTNEIKTYKVEISDTKAVTFDVNVAGAIDTALKEMKVNANFSFEGQARDEKRRKLTFVVEF